MPTFIFCFVVVRHLATVKSTGPFASADLPCS